MMDSLGCKKSIGAQRACKGVVLPPDSGYLSGVSP